MLFTELVDVVRQFAPLIVGLAVLLIIIVPPLCRSVINAFTIGKKVGEEVKARKEMNDKNPE